MKRSSPLLVPSLLALLAAVSCGAETWTLAPTIDQRKTCRMVTMALEGNHYRRLAVDDELSRRILDRYLEALDPSRLFLLQGDVQQFLRYSLVLDDAIEVGDLTAAYEIFNRFQERRVAVFERTLEWVGDDLDGLTFDGDAWMETDRDDEPWPRDEEEQAALWRLRFENDALSLRLADKSMEEISDLLTRRYEDRLRRAEQVNGKDAFRVFMNAVTGCFGPHTEYFPPHESENFNIQLGLTVHGIGALLGTEDEYCQVNEVIAGGPAERDGRLKEGDRIVSVGQGADGDLVDVVGWRNDEIVDLIRGEKGTVVRLGILPAGVNDLASAKVYALTRDEVKLEEQSAKSRIEETVRDGRAWKVGVIELRAFYMDFEAARRGDEDYKSATRDVARLIDELKADGVDGIVLDLRGNGGGSLNEAEDLTALFLGDGPVVQVRDMRDRVEVLPGDDRGPARAAKWDGPLCVMIDRISVSASEIFAAAVQDAGRGVVVGQRTFGKGTVQRLVPMGGGQLKITLAKFYRVSGGSTQHLGVVPDVAFPSLYDPEDIGESALDEALPWDQIEAVPHRHDPRVSDLRDLLQRRHEERRAGDAELTYLLERVAYAERIAADTRLSLNEAERRRQREEAEEGLLAIENRRRVALGLDELGSLDEPDADALRDRDRPDPLVEEAIQVLLDDCTAARDR